LGCTVGLIAANAVTRLRTAASRGSFRTGFLGFHGSILVVFCIAVCGRPLCGTLSMTGPVWGIVPRSHNV
jgi:hypothetical protein